MSSVTLSTLQTNVRNRTDKDDTDRWPDSLLTTVLNDSIKELWDTLIIYNPDPITTSYDYTTDGTEDYALPSDLYAIRGVDLEHSTNNVSTLTPFSFAERNIYKTLPLGLYGDFYGVPMYYDRRGNNLIIAPYSSSGETLTLYYIAYPTTLSSASDSIDFQNGWEDFVLWSAAARLTPRDEEQENANLFLAFKNEALQRIKTAAISLGTRPRTATNVKALRRWSRYPY